MDILTRGAIVMCKSMGTDLQKWMLDSNPHFLPVEMLSDGDILVIDIEGYGPYILCKNGYIQVVEYHYKHYHGIEGITTQWEREWERR